MSRKPKENISEQPASYHIEGARSEDRLSIRASISQKETIQRAANAQHMNVSQFVLQASIQAAERVLEYESTVIVSSNQFDSICQLLDAPVLPMERLRKAIREKPNWHV